MKQCFIFRLLDLEIKTLIIEKYPSDWWGHQTSGVQAPEPCSPSVFLLVDREDEDAQEDDKDQVFEED